MGSSGVFRYPEKGVKLDCQVWVYPKLTLLVMNNSQLTGSMIKFNSSGTHFHKHSAFYSGRVDSSLDNPVPSFA